MLSHLKVQLQALLEESLKEAFPQQQDFPSIELERPSEKIHGDMACNVALKSAKILRKSPLQIANEILLVLNKNLNTLNGQVLKVEVKNPGFINFYLSPEAFYSVLTEIFKQDEKFGRSDIGQKAKVQIEFVSANPTGPLSVAHARQAAVGDALGNILEAVGFKVTKEYYVNDEGNQINILGNSIRLRAKEILGERIEFPEDGYQGEYIKDMAREYLKKSKIDTLEKLAKHSLEKFRQFGVDYLMDVIKKDLEDFRARFDVWSHQSKIATPKSIAAVLELLKKKGFVYEKEGALWFRSTDFGDDKDRVVKKSDGSYTYLTPDIVYHKHKYERGFQKVFNIWGPDHHGYIPRVKAAVQALGYDPNSLNVLIVQLATIYRDGKPLSMSTRRGQFISLREVIDEVGVDAARYFFLMRHISGHLEFDLELAKKQTAENPVYYIQYAHARVHSINKKVKELKLKSKQKDFSLLKEETELDLIKKLAAFGEILMVCQQESDPYALAGYLQELAIVFHKFYESNRIVDVDPELGSERLGLANATRIVLANGLKLLGMATPETM